LRDDSRGRRSLIVRATLQVLPRGFSQQRSCPRHGALVRRARCLGGARLRPRAARARHPRRGDAQRPEHVQSARRGPNAGGQTESDTSTGENETKREHLIERGSTPAASPVADASPVANAPSHSYTGVVVQGAYVVAGLQHPSAPAHGLRRAPSRTVSAPAFASFSLLLAVYGTP
jgi:hypothetical protein